jgi:radical SAM superfamily enzyme YgiQ (UPF0313 family)
MKILLTNAIVRNEAGFNIADDRLVNMGLHFLGAVLKKKHQVRYWEFSQFTADETFLRDLRDFGPDVVCISYCSNAFNLARKCARLAKDFGCHTIGGGGHINLAPLDDEREIEAFDAVFRGESEQSLADYLDNGANLEGGIFKSDPVQNLDDLPFLDVDHWFKKYHTHIKEGDEMFPFEQPVVPFLASRGCAGKCAYCGNYMRPYRHRSPVNIIEEIKLRKKEYGAKTVFFFDETFTSKKKFILDLMRELQRADLGIGFECGTRTDCLDEETVEALKGANCLRVMLGIESCVNTVLKILQKGTSADLNYRAGTLLRKYGIPMKANFIVGIPGENQEHYEKIEDFIRRFKPSVFNIYVLRPHLHTPFFKKSLADNRFADPGKFEQNYRNGEVTEYAVQDGMEMKIFNNVDYDKLWKWRGEMLEKYS